MDRKIAIIGDGNVGTALKEGLERAGCEVRNCGKQPETVRELGAWGDLIVLAVPFAERENTLRELGDAARGKTLVDATNALTEDYRLAIEPSKESGAEQLQRMAQEAHVVKAFNTVFADRMRSGKAHGEKLTLFVAGDDEGAKRSVLEVGEAIGFEPLDAGPLENARWMEALGYFNIQLAEAADLGTDVGFRFVHGESS